MLSFFFTITKSIDIETLNSSNKVDKTVKSDEIKKNYSEQVIKRKGFLNYDKAYVNFNKDEFFENCLDYGLVFSLSLIIFFISKKIGIPLMKKIFKISKRTTIADTINSKSMLISILMTSVFLHMILKNVAQSIIQIDLLVNLLIAIKLFGIFSLLYSLSYSAQAIVLKKALGKHDSDIKKFLFKLLRISIGALAAIYVLQYLGLNVSYILALGGFWSIGLGFAAKDIVSNIVSLLAIMFEHSVSVGDMVTIEKHSISGIVESLGWRSTRIRNYDGTLTILPNVCFIDSPVINCSATNYRRIQESISIEKKDKTQYSIKKIIDSVKNTILEHDKVSKNRDLIVSIKELDNFVSEMELYFFVDAIFKSEISVIKQEILIEIFKVLKKHDCEIVSKKMNYISYSQRN